MIDSSTFPTDRLTFVTFADDQSVSAYLGSTWLSNEEDRPSAEREALFIIRAFDNGAGWARKEFPGLGVCTACPACDAQEFPCFCECHRFKRIGDTK